MEDIIQTTEKPDFESVWFLMKETEKKMQETDKRFQETDKFIKELGSQIGGLHNKFGSFTEGLYMPSLIKILEDRFECYSTAPRYKFRDNGNKYEIDIIGHATDAYYLVEIKSHLRGEAIEQLHKLIVNFKEHDKFYRGEKIYGVIVATDYSEDLYNTALSEGFFFISTSSNIAELKIPLGFEPVVF